MSKVKNLDIETLDFCHLDDETIFVILEEIFLQCWGDGGSWVLDGGVKGIVNQNISIFCPTERVFLEGIWIFQVR